MRGRSFRNGHGGHPTNDSGSSAATSQERGWPPEVVAGEGIEPPTRGFSRHSRKLLFSNQNSHLRRLPISFWTTGGTSIAYGRIHAVGPSIRGGAQARNLN